MGTNREMALTVSAFTFVGFGGLTAVGVPYASGVLALGMLELTNIMHDPLKHANLKEVLANCGDWILNLGMIGIGLLMVRENSSGEKEKSGGKKKRNRSKEPKSKDSSKKVSGSVEKRAKKEKSKRS